MQASEEVREQLLADVIAGFDSLLENVDILRARNSELCKQLDGLCKKNLVTPAATEDGKPRSRSRGCARSKEMGSAYDDTLPLESRAVRRAREISHSWHESRKLKAGPKAPSFIELPEGHPQVNEQDFTTPGSTPGRLGCPFAAMMAEKNKSHNPKPHTPSSAAKEDPIAAEFHAEDLSSPPPSASGSMAKCPIRFLDQHKPEEVAQYFENHKHEIPRSHEICIKRYQSNEQSIRQLDAKYGNLVNMIQGLGQKHKSMLPEGASGGSGGYIDNDEGSQVLSEKDAAKIKRWAGNVAIDPTRELPVFERPQQDATGVDRTGEERMSRFEKDLRDVRLGESPSRPWGIQVPAELEEEEHEGHEAADYNKNDKGSSSSIHGPQPLPGGLASKADRSARLAAEQTSRGPNMVFNGPVFFGCSADEIARLLKEIPELRAALKSSS